MSDWRPYDRLVIDVVNPGARSYPFALMIPTTRCRFARAEPGARAAGTRLPTLVVPLNAFPEAVNRANISIIHFYTERPASNMTRTWAISRS